LAKGGGVGGIPGLGPARERAVADAHEVPGLPVCPILLHAALPERDRRGADPGHGDSRRARTHDSRFPGEENCAACAAGQVVALEHEHLEAPLGKQSRSRETAQARSNDDDIRTGRGHHL
jgi:hypothetical protein